MLPEKPFEIISLQLASRAVREQAAQMLVNEFEQPSGWPSLEAARQEVKDILKEGFGLVMLSKGRALGWIGGLPEYDGRVWELHPLVVRKEYRKQGLGRALVAAFETEATRRGALTFTLGTDDDSGMTSLAGVNLYQDLPRRIHDMQDLGRGHPFLFYLKLGYVVTGVMPDANGPGLPDILMSKPAVRMAGGEGANLGL